jgi:mRNA interferase MazF
MAQRFDVKIKAAPKPSAIYWCSLHPEGTIHIPEFWKKRPVLIISRRGTLHGKVICLPMTTDDDNTANPAAIEISAEVRAKIDNKRTWVITDHPMTVATSRLDMIGETPPKISGWEFGEILAAVHAHIVAPQNQPQVLATTTVEKTASTVITSFGSLTEIVEEEIVEIDGKGGQ